MPPKEGGSNVSGFSPRIFTTNPRCTTVTTGRRELYLNTASVLFVKDPNSSRNSDGETDVDPLTKASWYAVEAFGKIFGKATNEKTNTYSTSSPPSSKQETLERLKVDNEKEYFLSGEVDSLIYAEDCTFQDPFVSFQGRDRFVENLQNLGSFITEYSAKPLSYVNNGNEVTTKFMVKLQLNLPWKPVLAWPWGVTCVIDEDNYLITLHKETWDIEALEVRHKHNAY